MKITFLDEAASEFSAAISYYDIQEPGLGQRFEDELDRTLLLACRASPGLSIEARHLSPNEPANLSILRSICYPGIDSVGCRGSSLATTA